MKIVRPNLLRLKSHLITLAWTMVLAGLSLTGCSKAAAPGLPAASVDPAYLNVSQLAGAATLTNPGSSNSFAAPAPNLTADTLARHQTGDANFEVRFIPVTSANLSTKGAGLGPAFNNTSCLNCHSRDGRGVLPPLPAGQDRVMFGANEALLIRISVEDGNPVPVDAAHGWGSPAAVPDFSAQLFHRGIYGLRPDSPGTGQADIYLHYDRSTVTFPDGHTASLRKPVFEIENAYDGAHSRLYQSDVHTSPRLAPSMIGLGLLEAVAEEDILKNADPDDRDHDGISGRANQVLDLVKQAAGDQHPVSLGRFGWKASAPSLRHQVVAALSGDMGMSSRLLPQQNIWGTTLFQNFLTSSGLNPALFTQIDADDSLVDSLTLYSQTLGVPIRRNAQDSNVMAGGRTFETLHCASCHTGGFVLPQGTQIAEYRGITIYPFTDLLLHDMGEGLADRRRDFEADGQEWRTTPLWGIGVTQLVNPRAGFLHDGRARSLEEAILWHGGEAQAARDAYTKLQARDRDDLVKFLQSL